MQQSIILPDIVQKFLDEVVYNINPNFKIKNKAHPSGLYALARPFVKIFNKDIDTRYITVMNGTCWFPAHYFEDDGRLSEKMSAGVIRILSHEAVHEYDRKRFGNVLFSLAYLFPQCLALLSLLAIGAIWDLNWLWWLASLVFLAPLPAPGRAWLEIRGYLTNIMATRFRGRDVDPDIEWYVDFQFASAAYYFMWPFKKNAAKRLRNIGHQVDAPYQEIYSWWRDHVDKVL